MGCRLVLRILTPAAMAVAVACGTLEGSTNAPDGGVTDAGTIDGDVADVVDAAVSPCELGAPFVDYAAIGELNDPGGANTSTPRLTPDELHVYFESDRGGSMDLWVADRARRDLPFDKVRPVGGLASSALEHAATVNAAQTEIFFTRAPVPGAPSTLFRATRPDFQADFGGVTGVLVDPDTTRDDVFLVESPRELWFVSRPLDAGSGDAAVPNRARVQHAAATPEGFAQPIPYVTGFDPADNDRFPVVSADGKELFVSDATQQATAVIYSGHRTSKDAAFDPLAPVDGVNKTYAQYPGWISPDHCTLYLSRARGDGGVVFDIVVAHRQRPGS